MVTRLELREGTPAVEEVINTINNREDIINVVNNLKLYRQLVQRKMELKLINTFVSKVALNLMQQIEEHPFQKWAMCCYGTSDEYGEEILSMLKSSPELVDDIIKEIQEKTGVKVTIDTCAYVTVTMDF